MLSEPNLLVNIMLTYGLITQALWDFSITATYVITLKGKEAIVWQYFRTKTGRFHALVNALLQYS